MLGCSSGIVSGVVRTTNYAPPHCNPAYPQFVCCATQARVLTAPSQPSYAVVGLIEVRTTRPKAVDVLLAELKDQGQELCADAVIPGTRHNSANVAAGAGEFRPFYVHDDGRTQVLEAQAIRYK